MHPDMNHSQSSLPSSLELLADVDILAKSVDSDFVPVSDVVLFKSFDVPFGISLNDLSKGTLVHRLVSDVSSRPSDSWWLTAIDAIIKHDPSEIEPAACAAEIYLARVAQAHIDAGHAQLDYIEGRDAGMEFIDSAEEEGMDFVAIVKQETATGTVNIPPAEVDRIVTEVSAIEDTSTEIEPTGTSDMTAAGTVTDATTGADIKVPASDGGPVILEPGPADIVQTGTSDDISLDGEEIQHDNVMGAAMGGLGLAGDEEISATMKEEAEAKQGQLEDIEIIRRKIEEGNRLQALLEKLESMTTEQDAVKRIEHHIHENENTHEHADHEGLEVKAGGT